MLSGITCPDVSGETFALIRAELGDECECGIAAVPHQFSATFNKRPYSTFYCSRVIGIGLEGGREPSHLFATSASPIAEFASKTFEN